MGRRPAHPEVRFWRDSGIPGVELRYSRYRRDAFAPHTHPSYSVGFIEEGSTIFTLENRPFRAEAEDMVVIQPGLVHACNPERPGNFAYWMFYLDPEVLSDNEETPTFTIPVFRDENVRAHWKALRLSIVETSTAFEKQSLLNDAVEVLRLRFGMSTELEMEDLRESDLKKAADYLSDNKEENITLDDLAKQANMSPFHFHRLFRSRYGLAPHAYLNQRRIDEGKALLSRGVPIADVALRLGFADQSHFSRTFRRLTGATPSQYRDTANSKIRQ